MTKSLVSAVVLAALAGSANAQTTVEFRIVERTGQTQITSSADRALDMAIQAKVTSAGNNVMLGGFAFDAVITGEPDANGALARGTIMDITHNYTGLPPTTGGTLGQHGLANQYTYLAGINPNFNGQLNTSAGTFTNSAQQEVGLIAGAATGSALLQTPGVDNQTGDAFNPGGADGNPDTWNATHPYNSDNGDPTPNPANNDVAGVDASAQGPFFAKGQFIDIYRFRYTVGAAFLTNRVLVFTLTGVSAQTFTQLLFNNGSWGAQNATLGSVGNPGTVIVTPLSVAISVPTPSSAALLGLGGLVAVRRRRA